MPVDCSTTMMSPGFAASMAAVQRWRVFVRPSARSSLTVRTRPGDAELRRIAMDAGDGTLEAKLVESIGNRAGIELAETGDVFVHRVHRSGRQREKRFSSCSAAALSTIPAKAMISTPTNSVSVANVCPP